VYTDGIANIEFGDVLLQLFLLNLLNDLVHNKVSLDESERVGKTALNSGIGNLKILFLAGYSCGVKREKFPGVRTRLSLAGF
jgi:hypothetical protein